jgi:ribosomal protein L12E/L44/L45/RPP1/RPP2
MKVKFLTETLISSTGELVKPGQERDLDEVRAKAAISMGVAVATNKAPVKAEAPEVDTKEEKKNPAPIKRRAKK